MRKVAHLLTTVNERADRCSGIPTGRNYW